MLTSYPITNLVFFVKDLEQTRQFYSNVLGMEMQETAGHEGAFLTAESGSLILVFIPAEEAPGQSPVVVFGLDGGIEDLVEALVKQNVEIVVPVSEAPDGGLTADFVDPDGHVLSLYQPADAPRRREKA
ncbi:MAG: VOC family protein [Bacteroidota bacterium]